MPVRPDISAAAAPRAPSNRSLVLWVITLGALALAGFVLTHLLQTLTTYRWVKTPCTVLSSRIADYQSGDRKSYTLEVRYEYTVGSQTLQSTAYNNAHGFMQAQQNWTDYSEATHALERYPAGTRTVCFVDPGDPTHAVLARGDVWVHVLMLGMTAMLWVLLRVFYVPRKPRPPGPGPAFSPKPISAVNPRLKEARQSALIGVLVLPMGLFLAWWSVAKPLADSRAARTWTESPCRILSSELRTSETRFGPDYSPNILFAYEFGGHEYRANKFDFSADTESKAAAVQRTLEKYPPGRHTVCYVNPSDPAVAVLDRDFKLTLSLGVLVPLFMLGGGILCLGIALALRLGMAVPACLMGHSADEAAPAPGPVGAPAGPVTLRADTASTARMLLSAGGAVICFGFAGYRIWEILRDWRQTGQFEISAIGVLCTVLAVVFGLAALTEWWKFFNPQPALRLNRGTVALGEELEVEWSISGNVARLTDVTFQLEAREEIVRNQEQLTAVGRQNNPVTLKRIFHSQPLAAPLAPEELRSGTVRATLPAGLMPTFEGHRSKIIWSIAVRAGVRFGSKMDHDFKLRVLPAA